MVLLATSLLVALAANPQTPGARPDPEATAAGRETYLGREVAHTMHWAGAGWLMRATREDEENGVALRAWLAVEPGQRRLLAGSEWIVDRRVDLVVAVAAHAVDVRDAVADRAGDPGLRRRVVHVVEVRIVEAAAEKRHRIVTAGAEA